jgi:hypothetical protein
LGVIPVCHEILFDMIKQDHNQRSLRNYTKQIVFRNEEELDR